MIDTNDKHVKKVSRQYEMHYSTENTSVDVKFGVSNIFFNDSLNKS